MYRTNTRNDCEFLFEVLVEKHNVVIRKRIGLQSAIQEKAVEIRKWGRQVSVR